VNPTRQKPESLQKRNTFIKTSSRTAWKIGENKLMTNPVLVVT
jgi:hypothetical protein